MAAAKPRNPNPSLSEVDICREILDRRAGIYNALTSDLDEFFKQCDPDKGQLCLYGLPNRTWQVSPPTEDVPPPMPEPTRGINLNRDIMETKDWLELVARHSDSWLFAVAFYLAGCYGHNKISRKWIYDRINDYPTLHERMTGTVTTPRKRRHRTRKTEDIDKELKDKKEREEKEEERKDKGEEEEENEEREEQEEEVVRKDICAVCEYPACPAWPFWLSCVGCGRSYHKLCFDLMLDKIKHVNNDRCSAECSAKPPRF